MRPSLQAVDTRDETLSALRDVLFDDHRRHPLARRCPAAPRKSGGSPPGPAQRDLVEQDQVGVGHQRPPDGHHLLLPARQRGRGLVAALFQDREELIDLCQAIPWPGRPTLPPISRFSSTESDGKSCRPSGTSAIPSVRPPDRPAAHRWPARDSGRASGRFRAARRSSASASSCPRRSRR